MSDPYQPRDRRDAATEYDWQDDAACAEVGTELFFPPKGGSTAKPKAICEGCSVRIQCLEYSLRNKERWGIWGGLSERERDRILKNRRGAA